RAKDEFIASVSHELRTPLTAVVGLTHELSEGRIEPHEVPELQALIAQQAQEVSDIVEDLLVAARASADAITIRPSPFNIRREIEVVVKPWLRGGTNAIDLSGIDSKLVGRGDAVRVRQIMRNLVANAVRYGSRPIAVEARSNGRTVKIAVRDHGDGIPTEAVDRMFEPYARLGGQIGLPSSVGLGLYVSRLLARMMDGDLQYHRRDGVTEFCLTLPVERRGSELEGIPPGGVKDRSLAYPPHHP
ncbi:MAG TPA: HAMP domain-containing sensor histidine kinase, partial [Acidimicrobiia bacterium]|nr:HAMP domain-containing sensor histidine kinase [Acidimicrobiia bacterium]